MENNLERFRVLLDHSSEIILLSDPYDFGKIIDANQKALEILGYTRDELVSMRVADIEVEFPISTREDWDKHVQDLKALDKPMILEGIQRRKNGTTFPVEVSATIVRFSGKEYTLGVARDITERKKIEKELTDKERYFRKLIEHSSSAIILLDINGNFIYQSPVITKLVGYEVEKDVHSNVFQFIHPEDHETFKSEFKELVERPGSSKSGEYRFLHQDGYYLWIEGTLTNLLHDETIGAIIGTYKVVEERKRAEQKIKDREAQLSSFFKNAPDAIIIIDSQSLIYSWNPKAEEIFGWKAEEVLGKNLTETIIPKQFREAHNQGMKLYEATGQGPVINNTIEITGLRKNSEEFPILLSISQTAINAEKYFIGFINDISERKKAQDALKESERKFRQISETINDVFYLYNITEKKYEYISKNCSEVLGADKDFFYSGKNYTNTFVHIDDRKEMLDAIQLIDSGIAFELEYRIIKNGEVRWIREKSFPIKDEGGHIIKNSGVCTDITYIKLQEIDLQESRRKNQELSDLKTKLISVLSHDLASPLNNLASLIQLKEKNIITAEELDNHSKKVKQSLENLSSMMKNLLIWSKSQLEGSHRVREKIVLTKLINEVIGTLEYAALLKEIKILNEVTDLDNLYLDKEIFKIVIRNFLSNALKFSHRGGEILISSASNGVSITISVKDNGIGMSSEQVNSLFSFDKTSSTGTQNEKGSGVGLVITKDFIEMMGGTISVKSEEGKGTEFSVTFPLGVKESPEDDRRTKNT